MNITMINNAPLTIPVGVRIVFTADSFRAPRPINRAARKIARDAAVQTVNRAVNAWAYTA